jgi:hypothetical protein
MPYGLPQGWTRLAPRSIVLNAHLVSAACTYEQWMNIVRHGNIAA